MVASKATRSSVIHLAVPGSMVAEICESLDSSVNIATAATIRPPPAKVTDLSFSDLDKEISHSKPTNSASLFLQPVKTKYDPAARQQDTQISNL